MAQQFKTQNSKFKIQNSELRHGAIIQNSKLKTQNSKKIALNGKEGTLSSDDEGQSMVGSGKLLTWMQRPHPALPFIII